MVGRITDFSMNGVLTISDIAGTEQRHLMRANYWKYRLSLKMRTK
jgi:hypothetical protein